MIWIKLSIMSGCGALNLVGGYCWKTARRYIMPVVMAASISLFTWVWWVGLTVLPTMGLLCIGYGEKSPFRHIFGDAWARFVWMALACLGFSLGPVLTHHLAWWIAVPYILIGGTLGITLRNIDEIVGDLIFGAWFGSIILFVR